MKRLRIDNVRQLRRLSLRLLAEIMQNDEVDYEKYKLINQYLNTISKQFQLENTSKMQIDVTSTEMTSEQEAEVLDKLKRMLE